MAPNCVFIDRSPVCHVTESDVLESRNLSDENGPIMEYYPRKYFTDVYMNHDLTIIVVASDPDGVHTVTMNYSEHGSDKWILTTLQQDEDNSEFYKGHLVFEENETEPYPRESSFLVQYIANDTLGNRAQSPLFDFGVVFMSVTSDNIVDLYETPDLWFLVGTTGHSITWLDEGYGRTYTLLKDGLLLEEHRWQGELTINVDGLSLGDHLYSLEVRHGSGIDTENVTVHVVEELPTGVSTGSVGPITDIVDSALSEFQLMTILVGSILLLIILVLVIFFRRQTRI